jgi:hypothetical protein
MKSLFRREKKRHQILRKKLHTSRKVCLEVMASYEPKYATRTARGQPQQQFEREMAIGRAVVYAVLEHLGYGPVEDLTAHLDRGMDRSLEYFFGDWWVGDEDDARALDKSRSDRALRWFGVLPKALLLGGLTGRWDDVAKICSWFDESVEVEYHGGLVADEYMLMFLCIASSLSPQPMPGVDGMVAKVKACRSRRPKLLCALWEATLAKDQKAFDKALRDSVQHFLKVHAQNVPNVTFWVALHPSIIWLMAERDGLEFPELPEEIDAAIVRRQTIGLA